MTTNEKPIPVWFTDLYPGATKRGWLSPSGEWVEAEWHEHAVSDLGDTRIFGYDHWRHGYVRLYTMQAVYDGRREVGCEVKRAVTPEQFLSLAMLLEEVRADVLTMLKPSDLDRSKTVRAAAESDDEARKRLFREGLGFLALVR